MDTKDKISIKRLLSKNYYKCYKLHELYILGLVQSIFQKVGIFKYLKDEYVSCSAISEHFHFHSQSIHSLEWMVNFLSQNRILEKKEKDGITYFLLIEDRDFVVLKDIAKLIHDLDKSWSYSLKLLDSIANEYENFMIGKKTGIEILFAPDKVDLWTNYFNNSFVGYEMFNSFGAYAVYKWSSDLVDGKLLELGGGTGGAATKLFETLNIEGAANRIGEYIFTDISPVFLRLGNRLFMEKKFDLEKITLKKIDFNKSLIEQGILKDSIDIVYAVNALHVSRDLLATLNEIRKILKSGGKLIISELIRPREDYFLCQEFIFTLLDNYYDVKLVPSLRPAYGFLTPKCWRECFETVGFGNVDTINNVEYADKTVDMNSSEPLFLSTIKGQKLG